MPPRICNVPIPNTSAGSARFTGPDTFKRLPSSDAEHKLRFPAISSNSEPAARLEYDQHHETSRSPTGRPPQSKQELRLPKLNWDGTISESYTPVSHTEPRRPSLDESERLYHGRRGSSASVVSASSSSSLASIALSDTVSCSGSSRKRQRGVHDSADYPSGLAPPLRRGYKLDETPTETGTSSDGTTDLEALKRRFFTHVMSSRPTSDSLPLPNERLTHRRRAATASQTLDAGIAIGGHEDNAPFPSSAGWEGTLQVQHNTPNPVTPPATRASHSQFDAPRNVTMLSPTGSSERAYTQIVERDCPGFNGAQGKSALPMHSSARSKHRPTKSAYDLQAPCAENNDPSSNVTDHSQHPSPLMNMTGVASADHPSSFPTPQHATPPDFVLATRLSNPWANQNSPCVRAPQGVAPTKAMPVHQSLPSRQEFTGVMDAYLAALSPKKLSKALITQQLYDEIVSTLRREKDNLGGVGTPQFRFWCRKHFTLSTIPRVRLREQLEFPNTIVTLPAGNQDSGESDGVEVVTHNGQPVVTKEMIYDVLVQCHLLSNHSGRDKTTTIVRKNYSWVPKVLIGDFIKLCSVCHSKKVAGVAWTRASEASSREPVWDASTDGEDRVESNFGGLRLMSLAETAANVVPI
ncbi:hypothetical protein CTheo_2573 [Ceratobasidium theobromae]|uniref:Uncharacterized protein n=1 Tax=Ceratobasidium theobromae TaxID=1582974 RepID=A0A5N5QQD7_9AGAM|nr:hypothetical protein CTheo_2573 [Ceratobasidium theobromae]